MQGDKTHASEVGSVKLVDMAATGRDAFIWMCLAITLLIVHCDWLINSDLCLCISHVLICFWLTGWPRLLTTRRLPTKKSVVTHNAVRRPFPTEAGEMAAVIEHGYLFGTE